MWNNPNGECNASTEYKAGHPYRYPIGKSPGDVIDDPSKRESPFKPGTALYHVFEVIIPLVMGIIILLFFLSTIAYFLFSILRLLYLDTLKPYKMKTLRSLGKHRPYSRHREEAEKRLRKWKKLLPTLNVLESDNENDALPETNTVSLAASTKLLLHPHGQKLSFTSPPIHFGPKTSKVALETGHPHLIDLLAADHLPEVSRLPSNFSVMNVVKPKPPRSRIPVPIRSGPWHWDPNWYKKQVIDETDTEKELTRLQSTRSKLHGTASERFNLATPPPTLIPPTTRPLSPSPRPKQANQAVSDKPAGVEPLPEPPTHSETPKEAHVTPSRAKLMADYTFLPTKSSAFTAIPKVPKQKLMILRAGPRRDSEGIKKLSKKRKRYSWEKDENSY